MTSCLETLRQCFEDIENLEKAISDVMIERDAVSSNKRAVIDNRIFKLGEQMSLKCKHARDICDDKDQMKQEELSYIGGVQADGSNDVWRSFYCRIQDAVDYNTKTSGDTFTAMSVEGWVEQSKELVKASTTFTGDECNGQYVDMSSIHQSFLNLKRLQDHLHKEYANSQWLKKVSHWPANQPEPTDEHRLNFIATKTKDAKPLDYITWLKTFSALSSFPRHLKYREHQYTAYLADILSYLQGFVSRQTPLVKNVLAEAHAEFAERWEARMVIGWEVLTREMPLYAQVTDRLFANPNTFKSHQDSKQYKQATADELTLLKSELIDLETARAEFLIFKFAQLLAPTIQATVEELQRRQARSVAEIAAEQELVDETVVSEDVMDDDGDDDDGVVVEGSSVYNPMNLPIGWDGKPVPFWLYKLHGLGEEFKCEICGNFSYWGRAAFEKHFTEWRHVHGLKCLRIEPLPEFDFITSIEDVLRLSDKVNRDKASKNFNPMARAEFEDSMGNVMNMKSYQELARQGLI